MAAPDPPAALWEEAVCSICMDFYTEPVTTDCGHSFCLSCISTYLSRGELAVSCPVCRQHFDPKQLQPNQRLTNIVQYVQYLTLQPGDFEDRDLCQEHGEKVHFFCETEGRFICVHCWGSPEHRAHSDKFIEEAVQDYKNKLESERLNIVAEIEGLRQLLTDQDQTLLKRLKEIGTKIAMTKNAKKAKLSRQISSLKALKTELEKKCEQPAGELLKDVKSTLSRCEDVTFQTPKGMGKKYKVSVTLDPDTAHRSLILSKDGRRVRWTFTDHRQPDTPKRFTGVSPSVLGREGFASGRHYWEMQLLQDGWAVGVAQESVRRKGAVTMSPKYGVWALERSGCNGQYSAFNSPPTPLSPSQPPKKLGLYLDYEEGRLSFYNAETMEEIYTFTGAAFTGTIYPYFDLGTWTDLCLL